MSVMQVHNSSFMAMGSALAADMRGHVAAAQELSPKYDIQQLSEQ
jgi:hypothetical protein